jgi:hypothetical protein
MTVSRAGCRLFEPFQLSFPPAYPPRLKETNMPDHHLRSEVLEKQIAHRIAALHRELGPHVAADQLARVSRHHTERLLATATVTDFVPQLVYRATKEDILWGGHDVSALTKAA